MIARTTAIVAAFVLLPPSLSAQSSANSNASSPSPAAAAPKRGLLPSALRPACSVAAAARPAVTEAQRRQARDATTAAQQAAILGDTTTALARLRAARTLDPSDPDVAYQLARVYESAGANDSATKEYCRFLTLGPNAADASDARARLTVIARPTTDPAIDSANASFSAGVSAYDAGRTVEAEERFTRAVEARPTWADAYFDRALAREAQGDRERAASDLELYLRINASAADRASVEARIEALRQTRLSPVQAFSMGLVVPGAGQFYSHRPVRGALYLAAAGTALTFAFIPQQSTRTVDQTATDPFGNPYTYSVTQRETTRPNLVPGLAVAAGVALVSAIDAAIYVTALNNPARRVGLLLVPQRRALAARIAF